MPTLKDIAQACGVSTATVSHVIHGRTDRVGTQTRERVMAALAQMRYRRTAAPAPLPSHPTLAVLCNLHRDPTISCNTYQLRLLDGILHTCRHHGFGVSIHFVRIEAITDEWLDHLADQSAGILLLAPDSGSEVPERLSDRPSPIVVVGTTFELPGASTVDVDNVAFGLQAVRYLVALGHRQIAFAGKNERHTSSWERLRGFQQAMKEHQLPLTGTSIIPGEYLEADGLDMATWLLAQHEPLPTAIVAVTDLAAVGLINGLKRAGKRVPQDVSVVDIDDGPAAIRCTPPLTTFRQPLEALGSRAAQILIEKTYDPSRPDETVRYSLELIERASTAPHGAPQNATKPATSTKVALSNGGSIHES